MGRGDYNLKKRLAAEAAAEAKKAAKAAQKLANKGTRGPRNFALSTKPHSIYMRMRRDGCSKEEIREAMRLQKSKDEAGLAAVAAAADIAASESILPDAKATQILRSNAMLVAAIDANQPVNVAAAVLTREQEIAARRLQTDAEEHYRQALRAAAKASLWVMLTDVVFHPSVECNGSTTAPSEGIEGCCYKKSVIYEPLHKTWCDFAQDTTKKRRGILAPRGSFKSSVVTLTFAVWLLVNNPNFRILVISAVEKNAINFAGVAKNAFHKNARMRWLFPESCAPEDSRFGTEQEFTLPSRTDIMMTAPSLTSAHLDASLASQHYDALLFDDPIEKKHVATEDQAAKAREAYNKALPLLDPGGIIRVLGTRWAHFDLYSAMILEANGGTATSTPYEWIVRSAFEKDGKPDFDAGDPIFPTRLSRSFLIEQLEEYRLDPEKGETFWWQQYMNICRAPGTEPFLEEWFIEIPPESCPVNMFSKMICIDTALKDDATRKGGDHTVIFAGGWDAQGRLYVFPDAYRRNDLRSKEFCDILTALAQRYQIVTVVKQKVSEDTLGTTIRSAFSAIPLPINYKPITVNAMGRKELRIKEALQGPFQRQQIFFVQRRMQDGSLISNPVLSALKKELVNLGQYSSDDAADTLANFFHPEVAVRARNLVGDGLGWKAPHAPDTRAERIASEGSKLRWSAPNRSIGAGWQSRPN